MDQAFPPEWVGTSSARHRVLSKYTIPSFLFFQMDFPATPLHAEYIVAHVNDKSLST
jgi:hypothetical protein